MRLFIQAALPYAVTASVCYTEDQTIFSSASELITHVLTCASEASGSSGEITTCMQAFYPGYSTVTSSCLNCTTDAMASSAGIECFPQCIDAVSSDACQTCIPVLADEWTTMCQSNISAPTETPDTNATADMTCTVSDVAIVQSGEHFVEGSLECLTDLSSFQTCIYSLLPQYNNISTGCKECAASLTITQSDMTIQANECGAICMQQAENATECSECAAALGAQFDHVCLNRAASVTVSMSIIAVVFSVLIQIFHQSW